MLVRVLAVTKGGMLYCFTHALEGFSANSASIYTHKINTLFLRDEILKNVE
jgi:hypothetical protein